MGFVLTLFYLLSTFLTPAEIMPILLPYRIMLVLLMVTLLGSVLTAIGSRFSFKEPQLFLVLALVVDAALSVLWALHWFGAALDAALDLLFLTGIVLMVCWNVVSVTRLRIVAMLLAFIGVLVTAQSIIALETGYRASEFVLHETDQDGAGGLKGVDRIRGLGVLHDPNDFGQFLLVDIALLGCCWRPGRLVQNTALVLVPGAMLTTGVLLTHSRGALLGAMVLLFLLFQQRLGKIGVVIGGITGIAGIGAMTALAGRGLSMQDSSAAGRLDAWYVGMQLFKSSPVFGVGYQQFTEHNPLTAHNSYMLCLAELGLPGLFIWLSLIVASIFQVRSLSLFPSSSPEIAEIKQAARSVYAAFIMFAVTAWFLSRTYATILFVLIGCAIAMAETGRRAGLMEFPKARLSWKLASVVGTLTVVIAIYLTLRIRGISV